MRPRSLAVEGSGELLAAALDYADRGWAVLPIHSTNGRGCSCGQGDCPSPGKHPRTMHGVNEATIDEATIREWWSRWPGSNIGIATGAVSGIVVLDIDPRHGGEDSLARLHDGEPPGQTLQTRTGGGGLHFYFLHPGDTVRNRAGLMPGIDLRGDGGFVVAPPSVHVSGGQYQWLP